METHPRVYGVDFLSHKGIKCVGDLVDAAEMERANGEESMGQGRHRQ